MRAWMVTGLMLIAMGCGGADVEDRAAPQYNHALMGSWLLFGASGQGPIDAEKMKQEESILVLGDSTYSLTYRGIEAELMFVESGKVAYDDRKQVATFVVTSATGMDWSEGAPRKLLNVPDIVPWQREPGQMYKLQYTLDDSLMQLSGEGFETSWFLRMPQTGRSTR